MPPGLQAAEMGPSKGVPPQVPEDQAPPESKVTWGRVRAFRQSRFSPLKNFTPASLTRQLDDFALGYLREFALTMDAIERRDDVLKCVAPKRKSAVARRTYEILTVANLPEGQAAEAEKHKAALEYFYANLRTTNAVDRNQRGGFSLLVRQMLDSVGKLYAVHELLWKPTPEGLTATFNFVPLWFFENLTGELRFLKENFAYEGEELEPGAWMTTVGEGLMEACSVAYMFKHLPLKDWLIYSQDFGRQPIEGITDAAKDSQEWNDMVAAVEAYSSDLRVVHNSASEIKPGQPVGGQGEQPFAPLVERMDRALAALWRGADLSTMSAGGGEGSGASLQGKESYLLECDDAQLITETLNDQIDRRVIVWHFGEDTQPLAYLKIIVPPIKDLPGEIAVDTFLRDSGAPLGVESTLERYGRQLPDDDDELLTKPAPEPSAFGNGPRGTPEKEDMDKEPDAANEGPIRVQVNRLAAAFADDLQPLRLRLERILQIEDGDLMRSKLEAFLRDLPRLLKDINADPESARVLEDSLQRGLLAGAKKSTP